MYVFNVEYKIRKGLSPDYVHKVMTHAYDDVPDDVDVEEVKRWARSDTDRQLHNSEDYPLYGKNWIIKGVYSH